MSKIDTIHINNFKFFDEVEPIELRGKHMLLYGENGCGKSSIYSALYTLFEATLKNDREEVKKYFRHQKQNEQSLVNIHAAAIPENAGIPQHYNSFIKVKTIDNPPVNFEVSLLDTSIIDNNIAKEVNQASDFISYKVLFKFQDFLNSIKMDLAEIFVGYILPYINFPQKDIIRDGNVVTFSNAFEMYDEIKKGPGTTQNGSGKTIQVYKNSRENIMFNEFVSHFNKSLQDLLDFVNVNAPIMLKKLGYNIDFELRYSDLKVNKAAVNYSFENFKIGFIITSYLGEIVTIHRPQSFLNEAKITAIAIAIRLTILKRRINEQAGDILKFLVFDDVMISLDMNNRDKLIDLLLDPVNNFTNDYQLLFFTHDRSFYDFIAYKINKWDSITNWTFKEMYSGTNSLLNKESPILIDGELEFIDKARKYYQSKDYTASAIYIRKEIEKIISDRLPPELKYKSDGTFYTLQTLWGYLIERYKALKKPISKEINEIFSQTKLMVLNPQAHFQRLSVPLYKVELEDAFKLIDKLKSDYPIPNSIIILRKGMILDFKHPHDNYSLSFELLSEFSLNSFNQLESQITLPRCKVLSWQFKNIEFWNIRKNEITKYDVSKKPLELKLNQLIDYNVNRLGLPLTIDAFLEKTNVKNSLWNLKELCDKSGITFKHNFGFMNVLKPVLNSTK